MTRNRLYYGDNLNILRNHEYFPNECVDLIYLDPPFNSSRSYNVLFKDEGGKDSDAQMTAFEDTWHWGDSAERTYSELISGKKFGTDEALAIPAHVSRIIGSLRDIIGTNQMMAYLVMMAARLAELHRVLKPTGSLYLHCDPTASHYLKIILDAIFSAENFRNEIIWKRTTTHSDAKRWSPVSDTILYYTKSDKFTWNPQHGAYAEQYTDGKYRYDDNDGRGLYTLSDMTSPNPRPNMMYEWKGYPFPPKGWRYARDTMQKLDDEGRIWYPEDKTKRPRLKRFLNEMSGRILDNVWTDIHPVNSQAKERTGYPTQKPISLLERIILASSNPGDIVLDPFSGCGTAVAAAHKNNRYWRGIDITHLSITVQKLQLEQLFDIHAKQDYDVIGEPQDVDGAKALAQQNRHQFEWWAVSLVGARPSGGGTSAAPGSRPKGKKGGDKGIDGIITFMEKNGKMQRVLVSVKSNATVIPEMIRDLRGTLEREQAAIGLLITLNEPTDGMKKEAVSAGFYTSEMWQKTYPKLQILSIADLFENKRVLMPPSHGTFKDSGRLATEQPEQKALWQGET